MSSQHRAHERRNKIIKTAWSGLLARIISVSVSLLMVPLAVHYLGAEQYGLWVAVSSLVAMLGFMDGGAGNAVINLVAHASGSKNADLPKIVSTAFFCLMALAVIGCLLFLAVFPFVSWDKLLGVAGTISVADLNIVVIIVGLFFFLSIFTTLVGKIQRGLQEGNLDNFWSGVAALLSLLFVYLAIQKDMGLVGFVIAFLGGSLLAYLGSNIHYLLIHRAELRPRLSNVDKAIAKNLFTVGGMFFVLQIGGAIQAQADNVIIANMLGAEAVTNYAICMKLFLLMPMLFSLFFTPLWPAYREAIANGDMQWVRRIFLKSMRWAVFISIPSAIGLIVLGKQIIDLWVGHDAIPSTNLLIGCGIWMVISTLGSTAAMLANARQLMTPQIIAVILSGGINIVTTIWLIPHIGVEGAVYGTIIAYLLGVVPIYCIVLPKALH
ncbi:MAG: oligosaccharide flippase family protein [Methylococcales bacterium]|nr:oligosaccharide flippase family protein [Methylococcales bacterium]